MYLEVLIYYFLPSSCCKSLKDTLSFSPRNHLHHHSGAARERGGIPVDMCVSVTTNIEHDGHQIGQWLRRRNLECFPCTLVMVWSGCWVIFDISTDIFWNLNWLTPVSLEPLSVLWRLGTAFPGIFVRASSKKFERWKWRQSFTSGGGYSQVKKDRWQISRGFLEIFSRKSEFKNS